MPAPCVRVTVPLLGAKVAPEALEKSFVTIKLPDVEVNVAVPSNESPALTVMDVLPLAFNIALLLTVKPAIETAPPDRFSVPAVWDKSPVIVSESKKVTVLSSGLKISKRAILTGEEAMQFAAPVLSNLTVSFGPGTTKSDQLRPSFQSVLTTEFQVTIVAKLPVERNIKRKEKKISKKFFLRV